MEVGGRWGGDGHLFEAGPLLTFSAFRMGDNSRLGAMVIPDAKQNLSWS